jgi:hypothetical protein
LSGDWQRGVARDGSTGAGSAACSRADKDHAHRRGVRFGDAAIPAFLRREPPRARS